MGRQLVNWALVTTECSILGSYRQTPRTYGSCAYVTRWMNTLQRCSSSSGVGGEVALHWRFGMPKGSSRLFHYMKLHRDWTSVGRLAVTTVFAKTEFKPRILISVLKWKYFGRSAHRLRPFQTAITLSLQSGYFSYTLYESPKPNSSVVDEKQRGNWKHNAHGALLRAKMGHARENRKTEWVSTNLNWNAFHKKKKKVSVPTSREFFGTNVSAPLYHWNEENYFLLY
jgi:hypothetical protein